MLTLSHLTLLSVHRQLQDSPKAEWRGEVIEGYVLSAVKKHTISRVRRAGRKGSRRGEG